MIDSIYAPDKDEWQDQWNYLVSLKTDFFIFGKRLMDVISDKSEARVTFIAIEQTLDDALYADAKRYQEYFDDGRILPMSPTQAEWLRDTAPKRIVITNPATNGGTP